MKRVNIDDQLAAIPSGALVEVFQDQSHAGPREDAGPQFALASLLGSAAIEEQVAGGGTSEVTATADGTGTGIISATAQHVEVTSDDANKQITLPAATNGKRLTIRVAATGAELISAVVTDKVNNVVVGETNEAALVAGTLYTLRYVEAADNWVMTGLTALGAVESPVVPNALA